MRNDKNYAIILRKEGKSYKDISRLTGIPKSTMAYWFKDIKWSKAVKLYLSKIARENARKRMTIISHRARRERMILYRNNRLIAKEQFKSFKQHKLFIAGLMAYWGEGDNNLKNGVIRVTNTDPLMLKLFHLFIKRYLPKISNKVKVYLILYPDLDDDKCKKFWSNRIGIPVANFIKSQYIIGRHPTKRLPNGVCTVTISNRAHKEIVATWISLIKKEISIMRV